MDPLKVIETIRIRLGLAENAVVAATSADDLDLLAVGLVAGLRSVPPRWSTERAAASDLIGEAALTHRVLPPQSASRHRFPFRRRGCKPPRGDGGVPLAEIGMEIGRRGDLGDVERALGALLADVAAARGAAPSPAREFKAKIASDLGGFLFKEHWSAMAIAPGLGIFDLTRVLAWGLPGWMPLTDDAFQVSLPALLALQRGAEVAPEGRAADRLQATDVLRHVMEERGGLLGAEGGHWRCLIELDPQFPIAPRLNKVGDRREVFMDLLRKQLSSLEVGARGRGVASLDIGPKLTVLQFLYELHMNGLEYAKADAGVRVVRLQKHFYGSRGALKRKAGSFGELADYIAAQSEFGDLNVVEASVSDFGPGIVDGFLASRAGPRYNSWERARLLDELLHKNLSAKVGDPDAGRGISQALEAARAMSAFVSLRTGEFWMTMNGAAGENRLRHRPGDHPAVIGTHWQLLYPDPTSGGRRHDADASV